jgi:hypothetical protein
MHIIGKEMDTGFETVNPFNQWENMPLTMDIKCDVAIYHWQG